MTIATQVKNELTEKLTGIWKSLLEEFEGVNILEVAIRIENATRIEYRFFFSYTTKRGKREMLSLYIGSLKSQLYVEFNKEDTKEKYLILSQLTDKIVENIELLSPSFAMLSTFGQIKYHHKYYSKEAREVKKQKRASSGIKKSDVLSKKDKILAFYEELKTKKIPGRSYIDPDERRVFQLGGIGSKFLAEYFVELGIAKEKGFWSAGNYHTLRFSSEDYVSDYYEVMDEWRDFIRKEIGLERTYVHTYFID